MNISAFKKLTVRQIMLLAGVFTASSFTAPVKWEAVDPGTSNWIFKAHAISQTDVYFGSGPLSGYSGGLIQHFDGNVVNTDFQSSGARAVDGFWSTSSNDVWAAAGQSGRVFHNDGTGWSVSLSTDTLDDFNGIWSDAPDNVYVVGQNSDSGDGFVYHYYT